MSVSPEEFFMYLTIGLIVVGPLGAPQYRRKTIARTQKKLREDFESPIGRQGEPR